MFDLNTILSAALQQAVEAATKPLLERIAVLEQSSALDKMRLDDMAESIEALEERGTGGGLTRDEVREIADEAAEEAISGHNSDYDHDEFISDLSSIDLLDYMGDFEGKVRDAVAGLSFEVSVN